MKTIIWIIWCLSWFYIGEYLLLDQRLEDKVAVLISCIIQLFIALIYLDDIRLKYFN